MRLSPLFDPQPPQPRRAATQPIAAPGNPAATVVMPFDAPTADTFEQALTQATQSPASDAATPLTSPVTTQAATEQSPIAPPGAYGYYPMAMLPGYGAAMQGGASLVGQAVAPMAMIPVMVLMPVAELQAASAGMGAVSELPYMPLTMPWAGSAGQISSGAPVTQAGSAAATTQASAPTTQTSALQMPFSGQADITQAFGPTSVTAEPPLNGYAHFHTGVDFAVPLGTPIDAAGGGTVVAAGWDDTGFGNRVIIDHGNGLQTLYGHLEQVDVAPGEQVAAGQQIGLSGSTGNSTGPHLHFGVKLHGQWVDPSPYLHASGTSTVPVQPVDATPQPQGVAPFGSAATLTSPGADAGNPPVWPVRYPTLVLERASATSTQVAPPRSAQLIQPVHNAPPVSPSAQAPVVATEATSQVTAPGAAVQATDAGAGSIPELVREVAATTGVPASMISAVMQAESSGNPNAVSPDGAKGLMQLMDATAKYYGAADPFDPRQNLLAGARFLSDLLHQFNGDQTLALAAYNAGPGAVQRYGGVPPYPETRAYVTRVLSLERQYGA